MTSIGGRLITNFRYPDDIVNAEEEEEANVQRCVQQCDRAPRAVYWNLFVYGMCKTWYQYIARAASAHIVERASDRPPWYNHHKVQHGDWFWGRGKKRWREMNHL